MNQPAETNVATIAPAKRSAIATFANRLGVEPKTVLATLKNTVFKTRNGEASDSEMMALLIVSNEYGLNPFTRELFAFPDKQNGIVPVVSVDGWARIINDHSQLDGIEFRYADEMDTKTDAQPCPQWCECIIYRKDRKHPVTIREYLDEVYRPPFQQGKKGPWQTHTKRFLRHKTLIQCARIAFGFSGIYDEDEAMRIVEGEVIDQGPAPSRQDFKGPGEQAKEETESPDPFQLHDQYGEPVGEYADAEEFTEAAAEEIAKIELAPALNAFLEFNETDIEKLGDTRDSEQRQRINRAANEARARLQGGAEEPLPDMPPE